MTLEDKFKRQMGDLTFAITVLQHQLEEAQLKIQELEERLAPRTLEKAE